MDYSSNLKLQALQRQNLLTILEKEKFTDLQFVVGPQKTIIRANRAFLASTSAVFERLLYPEHDEEHPTEIELPDIPSSSFQSVLNFAYGNDPKLNEENILCLKSICEKFEISSLSKTCSVFWKKSLTPNNLCTLLNQAILINSVEFIQECQEYLSKFAVKDADIMLSSTGFLKMNLKSMIVFLQTDDLKIHEHTLWNNMLKWADYQCDHSEVGDALEESVSRLSVIDETLDDINEQKKEEIDDDIEESKSKTNSNSNPLNQLSSEDFHNALAQQIVEDNINKDDVWRMKISQPKDRKNLLRSIRRYIHWGAMDGTYFIKNVKNEGIFSKDELITILTYFQCPEEGCGDFSVQRRNVPTSAVIQRGNIELGKWTYPGGRKTDSIAFESNINVYLKAVGIFNCAGKCTAKATLYRGDNGKHNGMHIIAETKDEIFECDQESGSPKPMELKFEKFVKIKANQKYTIELLQKNENDAVSYQVKNGKSEGIDENVSDLQIVFSKAAVSKNGSSVTKGAIPTLYFDI